MFSFIKLLLLLIVSLADYCLLQAEAIQRHKMSMVSSNEHPSTPAIFLHAESPVWDMESQSLYFVDVHMQNVHRLDYHTGIIDTKHIQYGQVNVVSLVSGTKRLLVAVRSALYLLDWDVAGDTALRLLISVDDGNPDNVINEGKPDANGRFWAGTKGPQLGDDVVADKAILFSYTPESTAPRIHLKPVSISNGLTWALNNSVFYYTDSSTQKIEAFDYDSHHGTISGRRTILDITHHGYEEAIPDGMTIDSDGHLWVAVMFGGAVLHVDPNKREIVYSYKIPVTRVTSVCWGGPNLDELFVTTSKERLGDDEPLSGAIFTIRGTQSTGLPPNYFKFDNAENY